MTDLDEFSGHRAGLVRGPRPERLARQTQTGVGDDEFVSFQKAWFAELHSAGYAVPHWPARMGRWHVSCPSRSCSIRNWPRHDAPRLVLAFVGIHHAASHPARGGLRGTASTSPCPPSSTARSGCRVLRSRRPGPTWQPCARPPAPGGQLRRQRPEARGPVALCTPTGVCCWRAPIRKPPSGTGISYFLLDMTTPGIDVRPIRNAVGDLAFLRDLPQRRHRSRGQSDRPGRTKGWQVAQATPRRRARQLTMLELAERLGQRGLQLAGSKPPRSSDPVVADRLAQFEIGAVPACAGCAGISWNGLEVKGRPARPTLRSSSCTTASLLQRMTGFGAEIGGLNAHTVLAKPASSGWESGAWMLDFIGSWNGPSPAELERDPAHRSSVSAVLGLPREPSAV